MKYCIKFKFVSVLNCLVVLHLEIIEQEKSVQAERSKVRVRGKHEKGANVNK